jgi:hypothetical protein
MELTLNLGWVLVALCMMCAWLRIAPRAARERRAQFVALAVVILILLPAISMTDDLMAAQNPAEVDCTVRRDDGSFHPHSSVPLLEEIPLAAFQGSTFNLVQVLSPNRLSVPHVEIPSLAPVENRPPPAA